MEGSSLEQPNASGANLRHDAGRSGFSLLFPAGQRPDAQAIEACLLAGETQGVAARIGHRPPKDSSWLELIASGLTFDISGLAPGPGCPTAPAQQLYGFAESGMAEGLEAIVLEPGGHIVSEYALQPVVRTLAGLAANFALHLPVEAIVWQPAATAMEPRYFARIILNWLGGGAFPALGLTALVQASDGSVASRGLSHFIGQDLQIEGAAGESSADAIKLAIRVVDYLIRSGPLVHPREIDTGTAILQAEPSQFAKMVWVWREP